MKVLNPDIRLVHGRRCLKTNPAAFLIEVVYYAPPINKRWSTGVYVEDRNWKNSCVRGLPNAPALNQKIQAKIEWVERLAKAGFPQSKNNAAIVDPSKTLFPDWLEERIRTRPDITESTRKHHMVAARAVRACGMLRFADVTVRGVQMLDDHVRKQVTRQTSVYNYHKRIKPYIAIAERLGLIERNPYRDYKTPHGTHGERPYLTEAERQSIENMRLDGTRAKVRDMFIFSCYTGLAYADLIKVGRDTIIEAQGRYWIEDRRLKTGAKYRIQLLPPAVAILKRYDWHLNLACAQICNRELKVIAARAGINKTVTMHVGRHTFATWALNRGVPIEVVSKMLAHSDIQTTQIYAKIMQSSVDRGFEMLL